jgi:hypothetical protein
MSTLGFHHVAPGAGTCSNTSFQDFVSTWDSPVRYSMSDGMRHFLDKGNAVSCTEAPADRQLALHLHFLMRFWSANITLA